MCRIIRKNPGMLSGSFPGEIGFKQMLNSRSTPLSQPGSILCIVLLKVEWDNGSLGWRG